MGMKPSNLQGWYKNSQILSATQACKVAARMLFVVHLVGEASSIAAAPGPRSAFGSALTQDPEKPQQLSVLRAGLLI